jgi:hypothetical protein
MEVIIEIAGVGVKLVSGAGDFLSTLDLPQGDGGEATVMEIEIETAREVRAGQGLQVNAGPGGLLEFSMSGVECRLEPAVGRGRLAVIADKSVFEYAMKIVFSALLLARGGGIFHAAGLVHGGEGYLFAGAHEAGKSTIAAGAPGGAEVLGDENVAVRKAVGGGYWIYAMPRWAIGGAGGAVAARPGRKAPLAACFILSHGAETTFDSGTPAGRARLLFENLIYLPPEKTILETAMKFADELQRTVPAAGLRLYLNDMERLWDVVARFMGKEI